MDEVMNMKRAIMLLLALVLLPGLALAEPVYYADQGGVRVFSENRQVGLADSDGNILLDAEWDAIEPFQGEDYARVLKGELAGFVGRDGRLALSCEYNGFATYLIPGINAAVVDGKDDDRTDSLIDLDTGETLLKERIITWRGDDLFAIHDGYHDPFELMGPYAAEVYDLELNPVMSLDCYPEERTAFGWVTNNGDWGLALEYSFRDPQGEAFLSGIYDYELTDDGGAVYVRYHRSPVGAALEGLGFTEKRVRGILRRHLGMGKRQAREIAAILVDGWETSGIVRPDGTCAETLGSLILPPKDDSGLYAVGVGENSSDLRWGYVDDACRWVIRPTYVDAGPFVDGTAAVKDGEGRWTLIDARGEALPVSWKRPTVVDQRVIAANMDGEVRLIDRQGRSISDEAFLPEIPEPIWSDWDVYADRWFLLVDAENRLCAVDFDGNVACRVAADGWDSGCVADGGSALWATVDGLYGLLTIEGPDAGTWRVGPAYSAVFEREEGYFLVSSPSDDAYYYVDDKGNVLGVRYLE